MGLELLNRRTGNETKFHPHSIETNTPALDFCFDEFRIECLDKWGKNLPLGRRVVSIRISCLWEWRPPNSISCGNR